MRFRDQRCFVARKVHLFSALEERFQITENDCKSLGALEGCLDNLVRASGKTRVLDLNDSAAARTLLKKPFHGGTVRPLDEDPFAGNQLLHGRFHGGAFDHEVPTDCLADFQRRTRPREPKLRNDLRIRKSGKDFFHRAPDQELYVRRRNIVSASHN